MRIPPGRMIAAVMMLLPLTAMQTLAAGEMSGAGRAVWNGAMLGSDAQLEDGRLTIIPKGADWSATAVVSKNQCPFWNEEGAVIEMHITPRITKGGGLFDNMMTVGLITSETVARVQASDNFVGVQIACSKAKNQYRVASARKEKHGAAGIRGDRWGNTVAYDQHNKAIEVPGDAAGFDLVLTVTRESITAAVPGVGETMYPLGLTEDFWRKPYLAVQSMNFGSGRAAVSFDNVSITSIATGGDKIIALDLRPFANMGFRDAAAGDEKGGWTDQGENDLRLLETGAVSLRNLAFDIIDPATNGGKSAIMLYSPNKDFFPKSVGPVPVDRRANSLVFLHGAAWAGRTGALAARYRVGYADGSAVDIPIAVGAQIRDWWNMEQVSDPNAGLLLQVESPKSISGLVGIYGYRWINPDPEKPIASLTFVSAEDDAVTGVLAVSLVADDIGGAFEDILEEAFSRESVMDPRRNPPDRDRIPDRIILKNAKRLGPLAMTMAGTVLGGGLGADMHGLPGYADFLNSFGGVTRFPQGNDVNFFFWPYKATDWNPTVVRRGGNHGLMIPNWHTKYNCAPVTISYQETLAAYKAMGLKLILLFNTHAMYDGNDFIYVKALSDARSRERGAHPLRDGTFSRENLEKIVRNNATLVDYVLANGYEDTVAFWEIDNERWEMSGNEYAEVTAAHIGMLRGRIPAAKVIVCYGDFTYGGYAADPDQLGISKWGKELLIRLRTLGMADSIDYFAPHLYPFLLDKANEITPNFLGDWQIRNIYRSLDYFSAMLDAQGFAKSRMFATEWGAQSDPLGGEHRNDLNTTMAGALATAKTMMAVYSHPRVDAATWHPFLHQSAFGRRSKQRLKQYGVQSAYFSEAGRFVTTPPAQAVRMFTRFIAGGVTLIPEAVSVREGVHHLCARDARGAKRYYVVNGTTSACAFPAPGVTRRTTLNADRITANSILRYGGYGDAASEIDEILPEEFEDVMLPPYSISIVW